MTIVLCINSLWSYPLLTDGAKNAKLAQMCSKFQQLSEFETMSSEICFSDCSVLNVTTCEELAPPKLHKVKKLLLNTTVLLIITVLLKKQLCISNLLVDISEQLTFDFKNKNWFDCHFNSTFDQVLKLSSGRLWWRWMLLKARLLWGGRQVFA